MGLFSKKVNCSVCGQHNEGELLADGSICKSCKSKSGFYQPWPLKKITTAEMVGRIARYAADQQRNSTFSPTMKVDNWFEADETHGLWKVPCITPSAAFPIDEIIAANLLHNGNTVSRVNLGSAITRTALFGVVGGLTAKRTSVEEITQFAVQIITKNPYHPDFCINLIAPGSKVKSDSFAFNSANAAAQKILTLISSVQR